MQKKLAQDDQWNKINALFSPNKITKYPKSLTIEQMLNKLPQPRIKKFISKRDIGKISYVIKDRLDSIKLVQEQKHEISQVVNKLSLADCQPIEPYSNENIDNLLKQSLLSKGPIINALRHIQITKDVPDILINTLFMKEEEEETKDQKFILSKESGNQLVYNLLFRIQGQLKMMRGRFKDDDICQFQCSPHPNDLQRRAQIFAKLYLNFEKIQIEQKKIEKVEQDMRIKLREQKIEDQDMGIQVAKLIQIIKQKSNQKSFKLFKIKKYKESADIKAKFEKLMKEIEDSQNNLLRLKKLLLFKSQNNL